MFGGSLQAGRLALCVALGKSALNEKTDYGFPSP